MEKGQEVFDLRELLGKNSSTIFRARRGARVASEVLAEDHLSGLAPIQMTFLGIGVQLSSDIIGDGKGYPGHRASLGLIKPRNEAL